MADGRAGQPGLEGQPRFDLPRRRHAWPTGRSRWPRSRPTSTPRGRPPPTMLERPRRRRRAQPAIPATAQPTCTQRFDRDFFDEALGTYVTGARRAQADPCRVRSSNAGHVLLYRPRAARARRRRWSETLMARTRRSRAGAFAPFLIGEARYNPMSYPQRFGLAARQRADRRRLRALLASPRRGRADPRGADRRLDLRRLSRLPELFCGFRAPSGERRRHFYPACRASRRRGRPAAPLFVRNRCSALVDRRTKRRIVFDQPDAAQSPAIELSARASLRIGDAWVDLALRRSGAEGADRSARPRGRHRRGEAASRDGLGASPPPLETGLSTTPPAIALGARRGPARHRQ